MSWTSPCPANRRPRPPRICNIICGPTKLLPTDGIVKTTATEITSNSKTDVEKARAIYEWIVDNTFRNPKTRGCGVGDIRFMLESRDLGGKCADLNALYVGLARAAGLPARDVYGIRVGKSELGYKSLGASIRDRDKIAALPRGSLCSTASAGCRLILPTCGRSYSKNHPAIVPR